MICSANQLTGFYMKAILGPNELNDITDSGKPINIMHDWNSAIIGSYKSDYISWFKISQILCKCHQWKLGNIACVIQPAFGIYRFITFPSEKENDNKK